MSHTVLVTGATGLLGRAMFERFQYSGVLTIGQGHTRAVPPTLQKANLENPEEIKALMDNVKPQIVIHCAANKSPDLCDKNPDQARKLNVEATRCLAEECNARQALLIYISTDYVFPGTEGEAPYETDAETRPPNLYGQLKREGEQVLLEVTKNTGLGVVLRVPVLYGPAKDSSESAINCLVDKVKQAQDPQAGIKMDDWAQRYPTNVEDVARITRDIVIKYMKEKQRVTELPHILHYSSEDCMTKYDVCVRFAKVLGISIPGMIANKEGNDPNAGAQRPYDTHLSNKALRELEIDVRGSEFNAWWRRELAEYRK